MSGTLSGTYGQSYGASSGQSATNGATITLGSTITTFPYTRLGGYQPQTLPYFYPAVPTREDYFKQFNEIRLATDRLELILKLFQDKKIDIEDTIILIQTDKSFHPK